MRHEGGSLAPEPGSIHVEADWAIARLAGRQLGLVTRGQLLDAGLTPRAIRTRKEGGRLLTIHRGVYAVGHPALPPLGVEHAALLAMGADAALSHPSAAVVLEVLRPDAGRIPIKLSTAAKRALRRSKRRKLKVRIAVLVADETGVTTRRQTVTLTRPKR